MAGQMPPAMESLGAQVQSGAGPGGHLEGFVLRMPAGPGVTSMQHVVRLGVFAITLVIEGTGSLPREAQDAVLERASLWVFDPAAAAVLPALVPPSYRHAWRGVRLRVTGPTGEPVARARVVVSFAASIPRSFALREGEVSLSLPLEGSSFVTILRPANDEGEALPFAPALRRPAPSAGDEWVVALEAGVELRGVVNDDAGEPVPHAQVVAQGIYADDLGRHEDSDWDVADTRTARDGTFRLQGLAEGASYRLSSSASTPPRRAAWR
jgi:hypothetical protein